MKADIAAGTESISMTLRNLLFFSSLLLMGATGFAANSALAHGSSGAFLVSKVTVEGDRALVHGATIQNPDGCATANYAVIMPSHADVDRLMSFALTALSTKRSVPI